MIDNTSNPRAWINYIPTHGLIISGLIAVVALGLWVIPAARQWFWFIPDGLSWSVFWLVAAILISSAYYFARMIITTTNLDRSTLDRFRTGLVAILLYFSGAFVLEALGISPPVETWTLTSSATIKFFLLYTAFVVILVYFIRNNVLESVRAALLRGDYGANIDTGLTILQIVILFFVPAIILAKLQIVPVNPDVTTWFTGREVINTLVFFLIYGFLVLLTYIIGKPIVQIVAYLFRPVTPGEPSYDLYGPNIAWWIRLSIMFTIMAQFVCFFTAYFGLKLLLSEEGVNSIEVFSLHIPHRVAELLNLESATIVWTQLQVISMVVAFILSAGISYFAAMTIQNLLEGHPVSLRLPILVVVLGLLSTYCGFTMWNGSAATAEELRRAIQTTKSQVDEFRDIDINTLGAAAVDANAQVSALERRVEQDERERLEAQFDELNKRVLLQESSYQALAAAAVSFDSNAAEFARMADNERLAGASSLVPGYGAVAREFQRIGRAYKTAADSVSEIQKTHEAIKGDLGQLGAETYADIVKKAPLDALRNDLHAAETKANDFFNIDLRPVLENLEAELRQPLPPVFSNVAGIQSAQMQALKSVKDNVTNGAGKIGQIVAANPRGVLRADPEDPSSQANAQIQEGRALVEDLAVFVKDINDLNAGRQQDRSSIVAALDQGAEKITSDSKEGTLYFDRANIVDIINKARSDLIKLSFVDTDSLDNTLNKINGEIGALDAKTSDVNEYIKVIDTNRIAKLIPKAASYPKVEEFQLTPLALGVLKYFYLSLPLLLVQIFIDFGYTIGLIFGVSSMHRRSGGLSSVSAAAVSTTAARIVSPARAPTKTR
jgi:hypothetical protein